LSETQPQTPARTTHRALFLDRDGVINREIGYLYRADDVAWVDGIFPLCRAAIALSYKLVVVTNQSGIARGYYTQQDFDRLMDWMRDHFAAASAPLDAVYCCPYHPEHGLGDYKREHEDRKPGPGMLLRAARDLSLDLSQSILVGDRCSDMGAAHAAGLRQAFLIHGTESTPCPQSAIPIRTLDEVKQWLTVNSSP
jgi:D-glycero-D-manno-heptose 1,7-bisphosphate phosphatase